MISSRFEMVFTEEELSRIAIQKTDQQSILITADVHGMKCYQAKRFINNIINLVRSAFRLTVIHGYNHGTAIKKMLAQDFENDHVCDKFLDPCNPGVTHMLIAA